MPRDNGFLIAPHRGELRCSPVTSYNVYMELGGSGPLVSHSGFKDKTKKNEKTKIEIKELRETREKKDRPAGGSKGLCGGVRALRCSSLFLGLLSLCSLRPPRHASLILVAPLSETKGEAATRPPTFVVNFFLLRFFFFSQFFTYHRRDDEDAAMVVEVK